VSGATGATLTPLAARNCVAAGDGVTVVDPVWVLPVNPALIELAAEHELVITIEDNGVVGGCGSRLAQELRFADVRTPLEDAMKIQTLIPSAQVLAVPFTGHSALSSDVTDEGCAIRAVAQEG